jgi:hypothetical protein
MNYYLTQEQYEELKKFEDCFEWQDMNEAYAKLIEELGNQKASEPV